MPDEELRMRQGSTRAMELDAGSKADQQRKDRLRSVAGDQDRFDGCRAEVGPETAEAVVGRPGQGERERETERLVTRHVQMGAEVFAMMIGRLRAGRVSRLASSFRI